VKIDQSSSRRMTDDGGKIHFVRSRKFVLTILLCVGKREQDFSRGTNFDNRAWKVSAPWRDLTIAGAQIQFFIAA
jgi:hypothetical protein